MLSEYGDVIRIDTTRRQTTPPWVSKMADRLYHVASLLIGVVGGGGGGGGAKTIQKRQGAVRLLS